MSGDKLEEYVKKLEAYEEKREEKAKAFNPKELVKSSSELREVEVEGVGVVRYGVLTLADMIELDRDKNATTLERSLKMLWLMLCKAYPELTLEDVKNFPLDKASKILAAITGEAGFTAAPAT